MMGRKPKLIIMLLGLALTSVVAGCGRTTDGAGYAYNINTPVEAPPTNEEYIYDKSLLEVPLHDEYDNELYADETTSALIEFAAYYFARLQAMWDEDDGKMWGIPLHTPIVIVCRQTSTVAANRPDSQHEFTHYYIDGTAVYVSTLSMHISRMERKAWDGQIGIFIPLGLMQSYEWKGIGGFIGRTDRNLMQIIHYVMHALQPSIMGVYGAYQMPPGHGRIYYHLEINALVYAATIDDRERAAAAIHDALSFRHIRRSIYHTDTAENQFKISEGTAVYTELRLVLNRNKINEIVQKWKVELVRQPGDAQVSFLYGYKAGALYGILLDDFGVDWRAHINGLNTDLGYMLQNALGITEFMPFDEIDVSRYGYSELALSPTIRI